ncbi:hypothetical protein STRIP9103_08331 [Streptomyces ipomoeae 91-03]|jgi:hypothetical protein|uniref:Uncharacterized protein n=2 Tax=Streptomyces ipomoeae TaxID=103232 RepID=L1KQW4_9ACTN|nr:hypothetical protein STRIP9103_08331 [Streptomyces ipomoeae 91-03]
MDPLDPYVKLKAATALARKKLGLRYRMAVVPLDPSPIRGSHGRLPMSDDDGPLIICSTPRAVGDRLPATDVKALLLRLAGLDRSAPPGTPGPPVPPDLSVPTGHK